MAQRSKLVCQRNLGVSHLGKRIQVIVLKLLFNENGSRTNDEKSVENKMHLFQSSFNKYNFKDFIMSEEHVGKTISIVMRNKNGKDLIS